MTSRFVRALVALAVLLGAAPAHAVEVYLALDTQRIEAGQSVGLRLMIQGAQSNRVPPIDAPDGVTVQFRGSSYDHRRASNGSITRAQLFQYVVAAPREGTFTLGPVSLTVGKDAVVSNQVTLTVAPRSPDAAGRPRAVEATAFIEPTEAWEGQVVLYRYRVRSPLEILQVRLQGLPVFDGLRLLTYADGTARSYTVQDPAGTIWVDEGTIPLVAVATGRRKQPGTVAQVILPSSARGMGFGIRQDRMEAVALPDVELVINALPPPPPGFSGLVGDFELRSKIEADGAKVGASIPWEIRLVGDGDVAGFTLPRPPDTGVVRFYDVDKEHRGSVVDSRWIAEATFDRSIVPTRAGRVELPPLDLVVFSPSRGDYVHLTAPVTPFDVALGEGGGGGIQSYAGEDPGEIPVAQGPTVREPMTWGRDTAPALGALIPLGTAAGAAPGFGVGALVLAERLAAAARRRRDARRREPTARDVLAKLPGDPTERLGALDGALRLALAARAGVPLAALDRDAAMAALPDDVRGPVADATRLVDRARFADGAEDPTDAVRAAVDLLGRAA